MYLHNISESVSFFICLYVWGIMMLFRSRSVLNEQPISLYGVPTVCLATVFFQNCISSHLEIPIYHGTILVSHFACHACNDFHSGLPSRSSSSCRYRFYGWVYKDLKCFPGTISLPNQLIPHSTHETEKYIHHKILTFKLD